MSQIGTQEMRKTSIAEQVPHPSSELNDHVDHDIDLPHRESVVASTVDSGTEKRNRASTSQTDIPDHLEDDLCQGSLSIDLETAMAQCMGQVRVQRAKNSAKWRDRKLFTKEMGKDVSPSPFVFTETRAAHARTPACLSQRGYNCHNNGHFLTHANVTLGHLVGMIGRFPLNSMNSSTY